MADKKDRLLAYLFEKCDAKKSAEVATYLNMEEGELLAMVQDINDTRPLFIGFKPAYEVGNQLYIYGNRTKLAEVKMFLAAGGFEAISLINQQSRLQEVQRQQLETEQLQLQIAALKRQYEENRSSRRMSRIAIVLSLLAIALQAYQAFRP